MKTIMITTVQDYSEDARLFDLIVKSMINPVSKDFDEETDERVATCSVEDEDGVKYDTIVIDKKNKRITRNFFFNVNELVDGVCNNKAIKFDSVTRRVTKENGRTVIKRQRGNVTLISSGNIPGWMTCKSK